MYLQSKKNMLRTIQLDSKKSYVTSITSKTRTPGQGIMYNSRNNGNHYTTTNNTNYNLIIANL